VQLKRRKGSKEENIYRSMAKYVKIDVNFEFIFSRIIHEFILWRIMHESSSDFTVL
jgi:hypothetical protein